MGIAPSTIVNTRPVRQSAPMRHEGNPDGAGYGDDTTCDFWHVGREDSQVRQVQRDEGSHMRDGHALNETGCAKEHDQPDPRVSKAQYRAIQRG